MAADEAQVQQVGGQAAAVRSAPRCGNVRISESLRLRCQREQGHDGDHSVLYTPTLNVVLWPADPSPAASQENR